MAATLFILKEPTTEYTIDAFEFFLNASAEQYLDDLSSIDLLC